MHRVGIMLFASLATCALYLAPQEAFAQRVRYGVTFGGGGVRVGVGNGFVYGPGYGVYYGPGYGYGYVPMYGYGYASPAVVVRPYPVYQPQTIVVQPQYPIPSTVVREPVIPPAPMADGGEILLFSPSSNSSDIRYTLNGNPYTMPPGTKQRFVNDRQWIIAFESSSGRVTQYTLSSTRYKFKVSSAGVELVQTQDLPDSEQPGLPIPPLPAPPKPGLSDDLVIPPRPGLKTTP